MENSKFKSFDLSPQQKNAMHSHLNGGHLACVWMCFNIKQELDDNEIWRRIEKLSGYCSILLSELNIDDSKLIHGPKPSVYFQFDQKKYDFSSDEVNNLKQKIRDHYFEYSLYVYYSNHSGGQIYLMMPSWSGDRIALEKISKLIFIDGDIPDQQLQYHELSEWLSDNINDPDAEDYQKEWVKQIHNFHFSIELYRNTVEESERLRDCQYQKLDGPINLDDIDFDHASLMACWSVLLSKKFNLNTLLLGNEVSGRNFEEVKNTIGPLSKQVPIVADINWSSRFSVLKSQLKDRMEKAADCADFFDSSLINDYGKQYFDIAFSIYDLNSGDCFVSMDNLFIESDTDRNHLRINILTDHSKRSLTVALSFNADLFSSMECKLILDQFYGLLLQVSQYPDVVLSELKLVTDKHLKILKDWEQHSTLKTRCTSFVQCFNQYAECQPEKPALQENDVFFTYKQLHQISNQLAGYLQDEGYSENARVGICLPRSYEYVISILACLKAGFSYIPLDPQYPVLRLKQIIDQSRPESIITNSNFLDKVSESHCEIAIIDWFQDLEDIKQYPKNISMPDIHPLQIAYTIFTSGTTGVPKGVEVPHKALQNYVEGINECLPLDVNSITALSTVGADLGYTALFGALGSGRCLRIINDSKSLDPEAIASELSNDPVDCLKIVPSHLQALLESSNAYNLLPKKCLMIGGEKAHPTLLQRLSALDPSLTIINHFGPTETTVGITVCDISSGRMSVNTIGKPLANNKCYLLDHHLNRVGIGIEGDLYLSGENLSRGYLNRPRETAEAYLPDPFNKKPGYRMYASGDRARYNGNGELVFCGRKDGQVKIRGHRVELSDIEWHISKLENVKQAIVESSYIEGSLRIIAYVVPAGSISDIKQYKSHIKNLLPEHMQPHHWLKLTDIPLNENGKLDRKRLPLPEKENIQTGLNVADMTRKLNKAESDLRNIIQGLLHANINIYDNFFSVGADSIVAIQIVARARQLGYLIKPRQIFEYPTIAQLAEVIDIEISNNQSQAQIVDTSSLSAIQARFFATVFEDIHHYNQANLYDIKHKIDEEDLSKCITEILEHHDSLRLCFYQEGKSWKQNFLPYSEKLKSDCYHNIFLDCKTEEEYYLELSKFIESVQSSFDLEQSPLIKIIYIQSSLPVTEKLLIIAHHLLIDAVSWSILQDDLNVLYRQRLQNLDLCLPPKSNSYKHWIDKSYTCVSKDKRYLNIDHWKATLQQIHSIISMPSDASNLVQDAKNRYFILDSNIVDKLNRDANYAFNTKTDDILLAALAYAFKDLIGDNCLSLMLEDNGRSVSYLECDSSRTIGWFTSMYPVNIRINPAIPVMENFKSIKDQLRSAPESGFSYGVCRFLDNALAEFDLNAEPQICFNNFGRIFAGEQNDGVFVSSEHSDLAQLSTRSLKQKRKFLIEIIVIQTEQGMMVNFVFNQNIISSEIIETTLQAYEHYLKFFIDECARSSRQYTPTDFPLLNVSQEQLDRLLTTHFKYSQANIETIYPATPVQSGILFHSYAMPNTGVYVPQHAIEINAYIDIDAFQAAWKQLIKRYTSFRSIFITIESGSPLQATLKEVQLPFELYDWSDQIESQLSCKFSTLMHEQWLQPFDFTNAPLMRLCLIKLSEKQYRFIWTYHHSVIDGWSGPIVLREFFALYGSIVNAEALKLPKTEPYTSYIRWLQSQDEAKAETFWKLLLGDYQYDKQLTDVFNNDSQEKNPAGKYEVNDILSEHDSRAVTQFSQECNVTLSVFCQAAWALLLYRYIRNKDIVFGITVSGRPAELNGVETMVGQLINTLPYRVKLNFSKPLLAFLEELQTQYAHCNDYSYFPLSKAQALLSSRAPEGPFDTLFVFENYPISEQNDHSIENQVCRHLHSVSQNNYPISLVIVPGHKISITLKYNPEKFAHSQVESISEAYRYILNELLISNDETVLSDINLLSANEIYRIKQWSVGGIKPYSCEHFVHKFYRHSKEHQHNSAIVEMASDKNRITYGELNKVSNQFARFLLDENININSKIGICLPRSSQHIVSILACIKAGVTFVPIDPNLPQARISNVIRCANLSVIITSTDYIDKVSGNEFEISIIDWTQDYNEIQLYPCSDLDQFIHSEQVAYTIYTSGTSGEPKGVNISHRALHNYISSIESRLDLPKNSSLTALSTTAADLGYTAIFGALGSGRVLRIIDEDKNLDAKALAAEFELVPVDCLKIVPSHLLALLSIDNSNLILPKQCLILGGEAPTLDLLKRIKALSPNLRIINHYGPTEATIGISTFEINDINVNIKTIGRPLSNNQCYILDSNLQMVDENVEGDLYLAGDNIATGYDKQARATSLSFIPNPFGEIPGLRMYRSGDRAKFNHQGELIFCGRRDSQKKLRGYRIELEEIESILNASALVHNCAVELMNINGRDQLIAYIGGNVENESEVKKYLLGLLPEYMLPNAYVWLESLPVNENGKLDRRALPKPAQQSNSGGLPASILEKQLSAIWAQLLAIETIRLDDNFFDLGGDSLLLMRVHKHIVDEIDSSVGIIDLFKYTTVAKLAEFINDREQGVDKPKQRKSRTELKKQALQENKKRHARRKDRQKIS